MSNKSPRKTSKGPKPNPFIQYNRVRKNGEAQNERKAYLLKVEHEGRQAEGQFGKRGRAINAAPDSKRLKLLEETINTLREERQKTETNNTRKAGTKRNITNTPSHTDYSTNSESEEPVPPPKKSFREEYKNQSNVKKTNSEIFRVTRKALENRSGKRNEETKSRSQKRAKTQSAPGLLEQVETLFGNALINFSKFIKSKGT